MKWAMFSRALDTIRRLCMLNILPCKNPLSIMQQCFNFRETFFSHLFIMLSLSPISLWMCNVRSKCTTTVRFVMYMERKCSCLLHFWTRKFKYSEVNHAIIINKMFHLNIPIVSFVVHYIWKMFVFKLEYLWNLFVFCDEEMATLSFILSTFWSFSFCSHTKEFNYCAWIRDWGVKHTFDSRKRIFIQLLMILNRYGNTGSRTSFMNDPWGVSDADQVIR